MPASDPNEIADGARHSYEPPRSGIGDSWTWWIAAICSLVVVIVLLIALTA